MTDRDRISALFGILVLMGCAALALVPSSSSAAVNYVYQPPPGWHRTQYLARGLGAWIDPANGQTITVEATNYGGTLDQFTRVKLGEISYIPGSKVGAAQGASVCRHHPANYITYEAPQNGAPTIFEEMLAVYSGVAYQATYARNASQPSLFEARQSLTTLCGGIVPQAQPSARTQQLYRTSAPQTPYLGPSQAPETLGPAAPTVTPTYGP